MTKYEDYLKFDPFGRYCNKNYWATPSTKLIMTFHIKPLKPILAQIVTWHGKNIFQNLSSVALESSSVATQGS